MERMVSACRSLVYILQKPIRNRDIYLSIELQGPVKCQNSNLRSHYEYDNLLSLIKKMFLDVVRTIGHY